MTTFALASEYDRLTPAQKSQVDHIIADDGTWTNEMIHDYIGTIFIDDIETEQREGWGYGNIV